MRRLINFWKNIFIFVGRLITNNLDVAFIFLLSFIILLPRTNNLCNQIVELNFDTQNLLLWNYLKGLNAFPIRDTFFPHGFFYYFIANNSAFFFIYLILSPVYYSIIFVSLKKLYKSKPIIYFLLFTLLFLLINSLLGARSFTRYGMLLVGGVLMSLLSVYIKSGLIKGILVGLVSGLAIFSSEGIGILLAVLALFLLISAYFIAAFKKTTGSKPVDELNTDMSSSFRGRPDEVGRGDHASRGVEDVIKRTKSEKLSRLLGSELLGFAAGLFIGLLPLMVILIKNNMIMEYLVWFKDVRAISVYAKTPLILKGRYPFFVLGTILIQIIFILKGFKDKFKSEKPLYYLLLLSVFLSSLLLMPRYVVRQSNNIVVFYQLYGLSILFYPLVKKMFSTTLGKVSVVISISIFYITVALSLSIQIPLNTYARDLEQALKQISEGNILKGRLCKLNEIKLQNIGLDESYFEVFEYIKKEYPEANIFSYPYDPVFYLLFKQKPPPYPNVYEGSPVWAQNANIEYLEEDNIDIVIHNIKSIAVDGIPEELRAPILNKYILEKYIEYYEIKSFIIMKEKKVNSYKKDLQ